MKIDRAIECFAKASELGYVPAMLQLSTLYFGAEFKDLQNMNLAKTYAKMAAEAGSDKGAKWYGQLLVQHGDKDERLHGLEWLKKAEEAGNRQASGFLATLFYGGLCGFEKDGKTARYYLKRSES